MADEISDRDGRELDLFLSDLPGVSIIGEWVRNFLELCRRIGAEAGDQTVEPDGNRACFSRGRIEA